ncbi:DNA topoisomerase family protein [Chromatium okenii]|uniref:DNA topoisomerase family protein n=1 Tax=Chromatium okenii TaxID=61644 RepID=UPI001F5B98D7|nr:type I DNA topoisomerase [Chromatium okenii]
MQSALEIKRGRYGKFIGCSSYPTCKHIEPLEKPEDTGVVCPQCHKGTLQKKKSRRGKLFYSCSTYPTCDYAVWDEPVAEPCRSAAGRFSRSKPPKPRAQLKPVHKKECGYRVAVETVETNNALI